ncbi:spore cortex biosynthesis protein YabQ [Eubacteriales bacterium OttesenSCG-928-M02]|nr:spore cortex biosynthesis protein YabQ [Eubacteriales bacterium OttesenSCG-928-M02]
MGMTKYQPTGFLLCCALGAAMGLWYALLTPIRRRARHKWTVFFWDCLFWLVAGAAFIASLFLSTGGIFRVFSAVGFLLGFGIALSGPGYYVTKGGTWLGKYWDRKKKAILENRKEEGKYG